MDYVNGKIWKRSSIWRKMIWIDSDDGGAMTVGTMTVGLIRITQGRAVDGDGRRKVDERAPRRSD